jgi:crotonobetainyl-CoA:carnitine CoA-transferase CaiB-like acyl-CoA transferase
MNLETTLVIFSYLVVPEKIPSLQEIFSVVALLFLNLTAADFAGGGLVCALAIILALYHRQVTGKGQVVDVNMVDGVRYIATLPAILNQIPTPFWSSNRGTNILDGGAPWYDTYKTKDGKHMAVYDPALLLSLTAQGTAGTALLRRFPKRIGT